MKINKELLKGSSEILILSVLEKEALYGYEIARKIREMSNKVFQLGEGTMYPILHKLEKSGWLDHYWQEVGGRRRKYYQITASGKKFLEDKMAEWNTFSESVQTVIRG